jgi:peptide/nickel transport system permease protein
MAREELAAPDDAPESSPDTLEGEALDEAALAQQEHERTVLRESSAGGLFEATVGAPRRHRPWLVVAAAACLGLLCVLAITADWLPLRDPAEIGSLDQLNQTPGFHADPLGTDDLGRSELSRLVFGARVSIVVGVGAALASIIVGGAIGLFAGYFRGWPDSIIDVVLNALLAFPPLILLVALAAVLRPSLETLTFALAFLGVPLAARVARANTVAVVQRDYVTASRALGASHARIIVREILPNVVLPLLSLTLVAVAALMVAEGSLSYLGLGIPPPDPSWGGMVSSAFPKMSQYPHEVFVPAIAFFLTVASLNLVGDWFRGKYGRGAQL